MLKFNRSNRWLLFVVTIVGAFAALILLFKGLSVPPPTPAPPTPTPDPGQEVVARVGEQRITLADWATAFYLDALMSRLSGQPAPPASETLNRLVNDALILAAAAEEGIAASEADVKARVTQLEAIWGLTDEQVVAELAVIGFTREMWIETIARLLTVERYLADVVWADVPAEGQANALDAWLQASHSRADVEVDTHGLQPVLPTALMTPLPVASSPLATPTRPPLPTHTPTLTPGPVQVSPLTTPVANPPATPITDTSEPPAPSGPPAVGQPAPDFALIDANDQSVSLSNYRDQRQVIVLFFRTTG
jgi:hypothetical protein